MASLIRQPRLGNGWRPDDSRHGPGSVPVLDISPEAHEIVGDAHYMGDTLAGHVMQFDHDEGPATIHIGGSTLFEAATEAVICIAELGSWAPAWVASTNDSLAKIVAEHFTVEGDSNCKVIDLTDVKL